MHGLFSPVLCQLSLKYSRMYPRINQCRYGVSVLQPDAPDPPVSVTDTRQQTPRAPAPGATQILYSTDVMTEL